MDVRRPVAGSTCFISFLIGLGSAVVGYLPQVEKVQSIDDFVNKQISSVLKIDLKSS